MYVCIRPKRKEKQESDNISNFFFTLGSESVKKKIKTKQTKGNTHVCTCH